MSQYLDLPLRSLRDLHAEVEAQTRALERGQEVLQTKKMEAELELRFHEADVLGERIDALSDELGPLLDRLDVLEEEIAWRDRADERRDSPITL